MILLFIMLVLTMPINCYAKEVEEPVPIVYEGTTPNNLHWRLEEGYLVITGRCDGKIPLITRSNYKQVWEWLNYEPIYYAKVAASNLNNVNAMFYNCPTLRWIDFRTVDVTSIPITCNLRGF